MKIGVKFKKTNTVRASPNSKISVVVVPLTLKEKESKTNLTHLKDFLHRSNEISVMPNEFHMKPILQRIILSLHF